MTLSSASKNALNQAAVYGKIGLKLAGIFTVVSGTLLAAVSTKQDTDLGILNPIRPSYASGDFQNFPPPAYNNSYRFQADSFLLGLNLKP